MLTLIKTMNHVTWLAMWLWICERDLKETTNYYSLAVCQFVVLLLSIYCIFFYFYPWFFLCLWQLCPLLCHPPQRSTEWWRKKMSAMGYSLWEILIHCHWRQEVLSSHWLVSWCGARCQFTNHCELKSSIWF